MIRTVETRFTVVRGDADFCQIYPIEGSEPTLLMDDGSEIKMSLRGKFAYDDRINLITDKIRPELIIDGASYPLGVYLPSTVTLSADETTQTLDIEAFDQCWILRDYTSENRVFIAQGTNYIEAVKTLLTEAGIALAIVTATEETLKEDREDWDLGTGYLEIINQLLGEINYKELWFNQNGYAVLEPVKVPTWENVQHVLDKNNVKSLLLPSITRETDIYHAPNVIICVCNNPEKTAQMIAKSENNNLDSPLSIGRRGRKVVSLVKLDNIASQNELQAYADNLIKQNMYSGETVQLATALFPNYGVTDITAVSYDSLSDICIEHSWEMNLKVGGEMRHTLEKVVITYE